MKRLILGVLAILLLAANSHAFPRKVFYEYFSGHA